MVGRSHDRGGSSRSRNEVLRDAKIKVGSSNMQAQNTKTAEAPFGGIFEVHDSLYLLNGSLSRRPRTMILIIGTRTERP